jgi:hypothetical protein
MAPSQAALANTARTKWSLGPSVFNILALKVDNLFERLANDPTSSTAALEKEIAR